MLKTVEKMLAVPDRLQKVDPAAPDCDILVDSAVTVYPNHLDQWFSTPVLRAHSAPQAPFVRPSAVFQ